MLNLLSQLLLQDDQWMEHFPDLVLRKDRRDSPPSGTRDLCELIQKVSNHYRVIIAVDALDECNENREELLKHLRDLGSIKGISLFVTSRKEHDIEKIFQRLPSLSLNELIDKITVDIETYIEGQFQERSRLERLPSKLKIEIRDKLVQKADGM